MGKMEMTSQEKLRMLLIRCGQKLSSNHSKHQTQGRVLKILYHQGPLTQKVLQEKLGIQPGSMSEISAKLERKGFLVREKEPSDKRKILLTLTETGREDVEQYQRQAAKKHCSYFNALTIDEQQQLSQLLEKLLAQWQDAPCSSISEDS